MTDSRTGERLAVMANTVAEARHTLTVPEQRLILWLVARIEREDDALKEHTLSVLEFEEILGGDHGQLYGQMAEAVKRLNTRVLGIRTGARSYKEFHWLHHAEYLEGEGKVRLQFHDLLKPVLLQLRERFCAVPLKAVFQLHGGYAIRWLEMLYSRKHQGSFSMTAEELRDWLHIEPEQLQRIDNLQARAIEYPRRDLDKKSPLTFSYKPRKEGRRITGWTFTVLENRPKPVKRKKTSAARKAPPPAAEDGEQRGRYVSGLRSLKSALAGGGASDSAQGQFRQ
jgi:plasmid replication initiation protein